MTYLENTLFIESGPFYVAVKNKQFVEIVFDKSLVPKQHMHLLGASAAMYEAFGEIYAHSETFNAALDDISASLDPKGKEGVAVIVNFLKRVQDRCLHMRHLAVIGTDEMAKLTIAEEKA